MTPSEQAQHFLRNETQFHLGFLPTEQAHPLTRQLDDVCRNNPAEGVRMLGQVDRDIVPKAREVFRSDPFSRLTGALRDSIRSGGRIVFSGCGATGRLSILLETAWRKACRSRPETAPLEQQAASIMTGGDYALVRSVESFEDYLSFGRKQVEELDLGPKDTLVAVSEGGETSSVIGTALEAAERGASVFFAFNNPAELLCRHIERSRAALTHPGITPIDLCTGPMAVTGSTRMQATTIELLVLGHALETLFRACAGLPEGQDPVAVFSAIRDDLDAAPAADRVADWASLEADLYDRGGRITYLANRLLLDIFTDTTERAPTFMLPPFVKSDDPVSPPSWAFVKNPVYPTEHAWVETFGRDPRCLEWTPQDYERMGASVQLRSRPPAIGRKELLKFRIGNERDDKRFRGFESIAVAILGPSDLDSGLEPFLSGFTRLQSDFSTSLVFGIGCEAPVSGAQAIPCRIPESAVGLWERLAVKLVMNTLSTATMARLGRVKGNGMAWVEATNKKLIDRASRLIAELTSLPYADACRELFVSLDALQQPEWEGREKPSPVQHAVARVSGQ